MTFKYQKFLIGGYDPNKPFIARPYIPVHLIGDLGKTKSPYFALLDSGADRVIFPSDLAGQVDIKDFKTGQAEPTMGIAGQKADVYYHFLKLQVLGDSRELSLEVGFSDKIFLPILGRSFFSHFKSVVFNEIKQEVELKV